MRSLVRQSLERSGYRVSECASGWELLEALSPLLLDGRPLPYDLVVADIRMPGLTGLEVLAGMAGCEAAPPFILITAFGDAETHAEAGQLGAVAVLDKPFELDALVSCVRSYLEEREA